MLRRAPTPLIGKLAEICGKQQRYANETLSLLASANHSSASVRHFLSSELVDVTTEGFVGNRYHPGSVFADEIEAIAVDEAKAAFKCSYANVQPHSASSANAAVLIELLEAGDTIMGLSLRSGGHLTHGANASFSGKLFHSCPYELTSGLIDYDHVRDLALQSRPKVIICGSSAYPRELCFETFSLIAKEVNAVLLADISHISGLVVAGLHPSPSGEAQIITTSTYKQLCGPRGGIILSDHDRIDSRPGRSLPKLLDRSIFPLTQGTPDIANVAAKAAALSYARTPEYRNLMQRVVNLANTMATKLTEKGFELVTGGTDTHMVLLDLSNTTLTGRQAEERLEQIGLLANRNLIPDDPLPPREASGLRLGTNALASRGFDENSVLEVVEVLTAALAPSPDLSRLSCRVSDLCTSFPLDSDFEGG